MKSLANEFFSTMAEGAKKDQAANTGKYDLIVNGIKNENLHPAPASLSTQILPPMPCTKRRAIANPRPIPSALSLPGNPSQSAILNVTVLSRSASLRASLDPNSAGDSSE